MHLLPVLLTAYEETSYPGFYIELWRHASWSSLSSRSCNIFLDAWVIIALWTMP
jgi:hypothetical protein